MVIVDLNYSLKSMDKINTTDIQSWTEFYNKSYEFLPTRPTVSFSLPIFFLTMSTQPSQKVLESLCFFIEKLWRSAEIDWFMFQLSKSQLINLS